MGIVGEKGETAPRKICGSSWGGLPVPFGKFLILLSLKRSR